MARSKWVTPRSKARRRIARLRSSGWSAPKFCHSPSESAGSSRPLRPHRRYASRRSGRSRPRRSPVPTVVDTTLCRRSRRKVFGSRPRSDSSFQEVPMTAISVPTAGRRVMDAPYQVGPDVHVLPTHLALPGVGVLPINAFVLLAEEPVLVDTGIGFDGPDFIDALSSIVDPSALRWVWLTHDDADHVGSIEQVLDAGTAGPPGVRTRFSRPADGRRGGTCPSTGSTPSGRATRSTSAIARCGRSCRRCSTTRCPPGSSTSPPARCSRWTPSGRSSPSRPSRPTTCTPTPSPAGCSGGRSSDSPWAHIVDRQRFGEVLARRPQPAADPDLLVPPAGRQRVVARPVPPAAGHGAGRRTVRPTRF